MYDPTNPTRPGIRRRAREIRGRLDALCQRFELRTSRAYRLRGPDAHRLNEHMRRFWTARDRVQLHLHAARTCSSDGAWDLRDRLDVDWRYLKELAESPETDLIARN
ncbi:MAG: hypothetical protein QNJ90_04930 [Planctomycetota bacterium]|nr:hypothetical protein [Planctomycetota bacterium]